MRLEAREISAGYGAEDAVSKVHLALESGEFVGLIGPNGCGKSTLLRVLSRTLRTRQGDVWLDDRPLARWSPREIALCIAFVPQQEPAAFDFTVRDIVLMGRHPHKTRLESLNAEDYAVTARALADADILALAERPVTQLSGGERRRVLLARALAQQTPLMLLDEPTAHLDITHQVELLTLIQRLCRQQNLGALAALHDLTQAAEFCDRLVLMRKGRIIAEGLPDVVLTADNLRAAYGATAHIGRNPVSGRPIILSLHSAREEATQPNVPRVHVISGGGSGVSVMTVLVRNGFHVTAGVLNRLDSDQEAAAALGIECVLEAPFSAISPESKESCRAFLAQAQIVLVTPVPFGRGNLANLELILEAQAAGKQVLILGNTPYTARDFADGAATALLDQLEARGASRYPFLEDWPELTGHRLPNTPATSLFAIPGADDALSARP